MLKPPKRLASLSVWLHSVLRQESSVSDFSIFHMVHVGYLNLFPSDCNC